MKTETRNGVTVELYEESESYTYHVSVYVIHNGKRKYLAEARTDDEFAATKMYDTFFGIYNKEESK